MRELKEMKQSETRKTEGSGKTLLSNSYVTGMHRWIILLSMSEEPQVDSSLMD